MRKIHLSILASVLALVFGAAAAAAQVGGGFELSWFTVDGGGGVASGGQYSMEGTIGQADAGQHTGGQYELQAGFWNADAATPSPTATSTSTSTSSATATNTPTNTPINTATSTASSTTTRTATNTSTATASATNVVPSSTATSTRTSTATQTHTITATASSTATPSATPTQGCVIGQDYILTQSAGATMVPGTSHVPGSICNACTVLINLPFSYSFYGTPYTQVRASNKGNLQFASDNPDGNDRCLANGGFNDTIFAYWDDMTTNVNDTMGIFTSVSGTAPNRIFNIEWRVGYVANDVRSRFEVRLYEGQPKFDIIYGQTRGGYSATIGVQKGTGERVTQYACSLQGSVQQGLMLTFDLTVCPQAPGYGVATSTATAMTATATASSTPVLKK